MAIFPEEPNWENLHMQDPTRIAAELRDSVGKVVSRGGAEIYRDEKGAFFYPSDTATLDTVRSQADELILTASNERFKMRGISNCPGETSHEFHFHVRLA